MGEGDNLTAIVYTEKAAILLRDRTLKAWCQEGQMTKCFERSIAVKFKGMVLISTYLPVYTGGNEEEIEMAKGDLRELTKWAAREDILLIGGDFNAHVGGNEDRPGVCGKFGLRESNYQGRSLLEWCEDNNLCHVNSFFNQRRRGTWFHTILGRWYEIDGFIMRNNQRHKHARKMNTIGEASLSDHKPKVMLLETKVKLKKKKKEKKQPRIKWEMLRNPEHKQRYKEKVQEILEEREIENYDNANNAANQTTEWNDIVNIVNKAALEVCGEVEKKIEDPWMIDKDEEINVMRNRITNAIGERNDLIEQIRGQNNGQNDGAQQDLNTLTNRLEESKEELKEARKDLKRKTRDWEREWWEGIINQCHEASERGDAGTVYRTLKDLGQRGKKAKPNTTTLTKEDFKDHFMQISEKRFENRPEDIDATLEEVEDISNTEKARDWRENLEEVPSGEEVRTQMRKMRDSAPGKDGCRLIYLLEAGPEVENMVTEMVQFMFLNEAEKWEESLKIGLVIPLFKKKGGINDKNNYRGVCLLAMGSRILARVMAERLRIWAEAMGLLDEEQAGFRKGRSTADVTQVMIRIQEDTVDLRKRMAAAGEAISEDDKPAARLLDLRKAYPRVNKYIMWKILEKYGMGERCLSTLKNLHETTVYKIKSREGESDPWLPERGLREGCPSSPVLFNIHHQVVMRLASKKRKREAENSGLEVGIPFKWVPGSSFPNINRWEKGNSEAKRVKFESGLFADDTTQLGRKKELEMGVRITKEVMASFEERNNDDKEEHLIFGEEEGEKIRMLGTYMGPKEDVKQRIKRAGHAWYQVKPRLKGTKLSKKMQARIIEACVESTALFDCHVRTWEVREIKRIQSTMDKMYRYVWSKKIKPPLIQMQEEGVNMQDIRNELNIKTIRWKIEKRVYERIGHVFRMDDDRLVKAAVLGWLEDLERYDKLPGKKRKTILYWRRLVKEAGIDETRIASLTKERKEWKSLIRTRMKHLQEWDRRGGKKVLEERGERNITVGVQDDFTCDWEGCGKVCKSKGGLTAHRRRMHEVSKHKVIFKCQLCQEEFKQEANLKNHQKICTGLKADDPTKRKCDKCLREYAKKSFAAHYRRCNQAPASERQEVTATVYKSEMGICDSCGLERAKTNMSRHKRVCMGGAAVL